MKLLFVTPPMGNWAPWGDRHLAVNPLHAQVAAFIREKRPRMWRSSIAERSVSTTSK